MTCFLQPCYKHFNHFLQLQITTVTMMTLHIHFLFYVHIFELWLEEITFIILMKKMLCGKIIVM
jgi:hypothetical protein